MNKIIFALIGILLLGVFKAATQKLGQAAIDSMIAQLATAKEDTSKVLLLDDLSNAYYPIAPNEGLKYEIMALALAEKLNWKKGMAWANKGMGMYYYTIADYRKAMNYFEKALLLFEEVEFKRGIGGTFIDIGDVHFAEADYPRALNNYFKALKIYEETGAKSQIANTYIQLGAIYSYQGNNTKALEFFNKALKYYEESGDKRGMTDALFSVAGLQTDSVRLESYFKALKQYEELGLKSGIAMAYNNIGLTYINLKEYKAAVEYYFKSLKLFREAENKTWIAYCLNNIGQAYLYMVEDSSSEELNKAFGGNRITALHQSIVYLDSAIILGSELKNLWGLSFSYDFRSRAAKLLGAYENALKDLESYVDIKESIFGNEKARSITEMQIKYDQDKKDLIADQILRRQKMIRNLVIGGMGATLFFAVVVFRQRNRISKERKRSDELLLNILPSETAKELKEKGSAEAKLYNEVTVMFTDFKGFTQIAERLSPTELVAEIDYCFKAFDGITQLYNLEKIKTIGDSYMCAGGLPVANKTNAEDAVRAAVDIQRFMESYKQKRREERKEIFEIRIGIHTGPVVAGIVGIKKFAYDIWGDTVNIASRMESSGEEGKVNISGSTYELIKGKFNCVYRGKIQAKNKGEIDMYFVES